jgi:hypothetical protein
LEGNVEKDSLYSRLRERIVEHVFVGDALRLLWQKGVVDVEVLRSEFDAHGYDLVMGRGQVVRHIQFKTGTSKRPSDVSVSLALCTKPSGCVIWTRVTENLEMGPFFWFGGLPGQPLPPVDGYKIPLRATHNKQGVRPPRRNHRLVPAASFETLQKMEDVLVRLFGPTPQVEVSSIDSSAGILQGMEDARRRRIRPAKEFFKEFEDEHGLPH